MKYSKHGYIRRQKIVQNRLMNKYVRPVYNALQHQIQPFIDMIKEKGVEFTLNHVNAYPGINTQIATIITSLYTDAAKQAEPELRISKAAFGINIGFINDVLAYFAKYLFENVVIPISQTTLNDIRSQLEKAIAEGWGIDKTVSTLETMNITKARARTIVRTESVRAMNYAQLKAADDENYEVEKQWIAIEDQRTRIAHTHAGVDGERRDLYDEFSNGLLFPGDPSGPPEQTINCRCTLGYNYKHDLNGDLVPKENLTTILQNG